MRFGDSFKSDDVPMHVLVMDDDSERILASPGLLLAVAVFRQTFPDLSVHHGMMLNETGDRLELTILGKGGRNWNASAFYGNDGTGTAEIFNDMGGTLRENEMFSLGDLGLAAPQALWKSVAGVS